MKTKPTKANETNSSSSSNSESAKSPPKRFRMKVEAPAKEKLEALAKQARESAPGMKLGPSEILDWHLESLPSKLGARDLKVLASKHQDPELCLQQALEAVKKQKAKGERINLSDLLESFNGQEKKPRARKLKSTAQGGVTHDKLEAENKSDSETHTSD